jgi:REP element-mobilizing transposase RayT
MSTGYQIKDQSMPYYLTFQVVYWVDIFTRTVYRDVIIDSLKYCQKEKGLEIFAYVIMSNHIHLIVRSSTNDLSGTLRDFKKYSSKKIIETVIDNSAESRKEWMLRLFKHAAKRQNKKGDYQLWTHENHAIELSSNNFIETKVRYIHDNPVKAGIVNNPEDYRYSSAISYADGIGLLDVIPVSFSVKTLR